VTDWRFFEQAVAAFLQALDPSAKVTHDRQTPDADTGLPRQRDVWISTSFGGHIPIEILVSCKRKAAKLSQQDLDAFIGELRSSNANKGVLYAYGGFTKPALAKAAKLGVTCCVLLENQPPPLPEALIFSAYCFREQFSYTLYRPPHSALTPAEALDLVVEQDGAATTAIAELDRCYAVARKNAIAQDFTSLMSPAAWSAELAAPVDGGVAVLRLESAWAVYQAKIESWLMNGSYAFIGGDFKGSIATPSIDQWSTHPGDGWEKIDLLDLTVGKHLVAVYSHGGSIEAALRASLSANAGASASDHAA
jgi:hypothetical protein